MGLRPPIVLRQRYVALDVCDKVHMSGGPVAA
jgi:hypothetical protein